MRYPLHLSAPVAVLFWICTIVSPGAKAQASPGSTAGAQPSDPSTEVHTTAIPGPLHSFLRMAAISQKVAPDEIMPLVARNVFLTGYQGAGSKAQATEFLLLLRRYVQQARELAALARPSGVIRVAGCADSRQLLQILGYRVRVECGKSTTYVETADPQRAFLTIDSGFPLPDLEKTLQGGPPFVYPYRNSEVPVYLTEQEWVEASDEGSKAKGRADLIDVILHDPELARLYYSWAPLDPETQESLQKSPGLKRLVSLAASLDFYGTYIKIRSGRVVVPGGPEAEKQWADLVGASPASPGEFVVRLLSKDNGWLAAYYDSFSRISPDQQAHFLQSDRLPHYYEALRGKGTSVSAVTSVFRPDPNLLLVMTRLRWEANGDPHVPGNTQAWKKVLSQKANAEMARSWGLRVKTTNNPEGLIEDIFALSRVRVEGGPADAFLVLNEIDVRRPADRRLSPQTVELMASKFGLYSAQYLLFCEFPELSDNSIALFLKTADSLDKIPDHALRGNAMGTFEANVGLWQILARQGEIPLAEQDSSWQAMVGSFVHVSSSTQLFDSGHKAVGVIVAAAGGDQKPTQDELIGLLAGPPQMTPEGQRIHRELADRIRSVMEDQRLVSLDTLLGLGNGLVGLEQGSGKPDRLIPLADELTEFQMPRPIFTKSERTEFTAGAYNNRHTELQMRTDLTKVLNSPVSKDQLEEARGELAPFFRDTLVGFSYAYYEPPGAQAVHNNPLLVRSHDFAGETVMGMEESLWQTPRLFGAGSPAGGGAHLVGSLANLPYVLAQMEEDFISPENVQALIWSDLVPAVLTDAVLPRWWGVDRTELHAIALYQRAGEELLAGSMKNEELRGKVTNILSDRMIPRRAAQLETDLREGNTAELDRRITPADKFYLTAEFRRRYPDDSASWGAAGKELNELTKQNSTELSWERLSVDFGVPHPVLERTYSRELLNITPFPMFEGYSSRLLAETWDSTNLYWARLADEMGYPPEMLNRLAPELTVRMVAKIFATDLNDWPAILRAMREAGEEFRQGKVASLTPNENSRQP